MELRETYGNLS